VQEVRDDLKYVFGTRTKCSSFASSHGGQESGRHQRAFSGRQGDLHKSGKIRRALGRDMPRLWRRADQHRRALGRYPRSALVAKTLAANPDAKARLMQATGDLDGAPHVPRA